MSHSLIQAVIDKTEMQMWSVSRILDILDASTCQSDSRFQTQLLGYHSVDPIHDTDIKCSPTDI